MSGMALSLPEAVEDPLSFALRIERKFEFPFLLALYRKGLERALTLPRLRCSRPNGLIELEFTPLRALGSNKLLKTFVKDSARRADR